MQTIEIDQHKLAEIVHRHYNIPKQLAHDTLIRVKLYFGDEHTQFDHVDYVKIKESNEIVPMSWARQHGDNPESLERLDVSYGTLVLSPKFSAITIQPSAPQAVQSHLALYKPFSWQLKKLEELQTRIPVKDIVDEKEKLEEIKK